MRLVQLAGQIRGAGRSMQPVAALLTRLVIGYAFVRTGLGKLQHFDATVAFFNESGIPLATLNAALIGTLEVFGGLSLILGLGSRFFAALLSGSMVVALLTADRAALLKALTPGAAGSLPDVVPLMFLMLLAWVATYGPGAFSVEHLLARSRERREARRRLLQPLAPLSASRSQG